MAVLVTTLVLLLLINLDLDLKCRPINYFVQAQLFPNTARTVRGNLIIS